MRVLFSFFMGVVVIEFRQRIVGWKSYPVRLVRRWVGVVCFGVDYGFSAGSEHLSVVWCLRGMG